MEKDGRIGDHPYDETQPVYTAIDLGGGADSTAITWFQYIDKKTNIIDYYETNNIGDEPMAKLIQGKPYIYGWHFLPHDGTRNDSDHIQRLQKWRGYGLPNSSTLPKTGVEQGIGDVVNLLGLDTTTFHEPFTAKLVHKLKIYKRKFNETTGNYEGPEHGTASHGSDSFRYVGQALKWGFDETGKCIYNSSAMMERYESEDMVSVVGASRHNDDDDKPYDDGYDF
jgi:phage terminase large subunit